MLLLTSYVRMMQVQRTMQFQPQHLPSPPSIRRAHHGHLDPLILTHGMGILQTPHHLEPVDVLSLQTRIARPHHQARLETGGGRCIILFHAVRQKEDLCGLKLGTLSA